MIRGGWLTRSDGMRKMEFDKRGGLWIFLFCFLFRINAFPDLLYGNINYSHGSIPGMRFVP